MRRVIFLTIFSLLISLSAFADGKVGRREAKRTSGARLVLDSTLHDFGDVARRGGDISAVFKFRNEGTQPLVITRVITSCSCLKSRYSKRPIPVGGEGVIEFIYQPLKAESGTFHKIVQVLSNSVQGRELITIMGNSIENEDYDKRK